MKVEIDQESGFCFGVTTAIEKAEEELMHGDTLYCLGDIVHNGMEVERLQNQGLVTIDHEQMEQLHDTKVLLRAHGEPPSTYALAERNNISIIDATCPVVLALQRRIKKQFAEHPDAQIVIFGKLGHAEVLGLVGQTNGKAIVIEHFDEVKSLDFSRDIYLYSQTTKSLDEYHSIIEYCQSHIMPGAQFRSFDTICRRVANRIAHIADFASKHDVVLFVCGRKSSNGKVLFSECESVNPRSHLIESASEIDPQWLMGADTVGICGATSTPKWLMEECRDKIKIKMKKITIAIDGHSSCGKSTMAKQLARELGYVYVDTGSMYRTVTLFALRNGLFCEDGSVNTDELQRRMPEIEISFRFNAETGRPDTYLNGELVETEIRLMEVSSHVSVIAAIPFVREAMVDQQRRMGQDKGIVMDGRDIGTTVFPDAELKVFVTASAEVRAQRRYDELLGKGEKADYDEILKNVMERDYIDSHREVSPLRQADDAILLDNSNMTREEQSRVLLDMARKVIYNA